jgi:hypothetical protein
VKYRIRPGGIVKCTAQDTVKFADQILYMEMYSPAIMKCNAKEHWDVQSEYIKMYSPGMKKDTASA